jgi:hypothetical protein
VFPETQLGFKGVGLESEPTRDDTIVA